MYKNIERPWQIAFEQGWEALVNGSIPIGAVITDEHGKIISKGRNRLFESSTKNPKVAHAETEAIRNLDVSKYPNTYDYTLFACMEPCPMCMGTIVMSNLRKLPLKKLNDTNIQKRNRLFDITYFLKLISIRPV